MRSRQHPGKKKTHNRRDLQMVDTIDTCGHGKNDQDVGQQWYLHTDVPRDFSAPIYQDYEQEYPD
jgi:hypothetical protein